MKWLEWLKKLFSFFRKKKDEKPEEPSFPKSKRNNGNEDVSGWLETVKISNVRFESPGIKWDYDPKGKQLQQGWKSKYDDGKPLNGCLAVLVEKDGELHQCNIDYIRPGMNFQTLSPFQKHGNLLKPPLRGWSAQSGERLGVYVTGLNWAYGGGTRERSNVVWVSYP
jgi:hypothetical protein